MFYFVLHNQELNTKLCNMNERYLQIKTLVEDKIQIAKQQAYEAIQKYWLRVALLAFAAILVQQKDLSINLQLNAIEQPFSFSNNQPVENTPQIAGQAMNTSLLTRSSSSAPKAKPAAYTTNTKVKKQSKKDDNLANTYSNMVYTDKKFATNEKEKARQKKREKQLKYVAKYEKIARKEMEKFGIPASITLAQGLLESNAGESRLATKNKNHFGIKCFSRSCKKGHCSNFTDDSHKDFFRKYNNTWESFRAHSLLLKNKRYRGLYKYPKSDYKNWARGLKKAGYATDKHYAEKLINTIEYLGLQKYDR